MKDQEHTRQDLSQPALENLLENIPSKYKIVIEATIRAKNIKKLADEGQYKMDKWQKPLTIALNDIAAGKVDQEVIRDIDKSLDSILDEEGVVSTFGGDEHDEYEAEAGSDGFDVDLGSKIFGDIDDDEDIDEDLEDADEFPKDRLIPKWKTPDIDIMEDSDDDLIVADVSSDLEIGILGPAVDGFSTEDLVFDDASVEETDELDDLLEDSDLDIDLDALDIDPDLLDKDDDE